MNRIEIEYCTQCRWLMRAAWIAQELLTTAPDKTGIPAFAGNDCVGVVLVAPQRSADYRR